MAWIELHQTLPTNKKTLRLKRLLKCNTAQAVGHVCMLWLWALDNAEDGDLSAFDGDEIAEISGYTGKGDFVLALQHAGFLDGMMIHDWSEYSGALIGKREYLREQNRERKRKQRDKIKESRVTNSDSHAGVTRDMDVTGCDSVTQVSRNVTPPQYSTVQNSTVHNQEDNYNPSLQNERNNNIQDHNSGFLSERNRVKSVFDYSDAPIPGVPDKELPGVRIRLQDGRQVPESMIKVARQTYRRDADQRGETIP